MQLAAESLEQRKGDLAKDATVTSGTGRRAQTARSQAMLRDVRVREAASLFRSRHVFSGLPVALLLIGIFWHAGYPGARVAGLLLLFLVLVAIQTAELFFSRRFSEPSHEAVMRTVGVLALLVECVLLVLTGGLQSPLVIGLVIYPATAFATFGRGRESDKALVAMLSLALLLALLPEQVVGPRLPPLHLAAGVILVLTIGLFRLRALHFRISDGNLRAVVELERLRAENLRLATEREERLRQVGAKVAHELKNPLSAIQGLVQLLQRGAADERTRERLEVIGAEAARMTVLVRDYLSLSRPLEDLRLEPVELGALCRDVCTVLGASAEGSGVRLTSDGELRLLGDPRRLKEALLNLVSNALEATPRGGEVKMQVRHAAPLAEVAVTDTGRGMSTEELARVGTPFFTTRERGTGLGALLARAVAEQHGGTLRYQSDPGRGTTALFTISAKDV